MRFPTSENQAGHNSKPMAVASQPNGFSRDLRLHPHKNQQIYGLQYSTDGRICKGFTVLKVVSHIFGYKGNTFLDILINPDIRDRSVLQVMSYMLFTADISGTYPLAYHIPAS